MVNHAQLVAKSLLDLPLLKDGTPLTKRQICLGANTLRLLEETPAYLAVEVSNVDVCCHVLSCCMYSCFQAIENDSDEVEFMLNVVIRSVAFLANDARSTKRMVDSVGGDMLGRAIVSAVQVLFERAESCIFWKSLMSDLLIVLIFSFVVSRDLDARSLLVLMCRRHAFHSIFVVGFSVVGSSMEDDGFVCLVAVLLVQVAHCAFVTREAAMVESAVTELHQSRFFHAVCAYAAAYFLRNVIPHDCTVIFCLISIVNLILGYCPSIRQDPISMKELSQISRVIVKHEFDGKLKEKLDILMCTTLDGSLSLFSFLTPFEFCSHLLGYDELDYPSCSWCGIVDVPLFSCSKCHVEAYCKKRCQVLHWDIHRQTCTPKKY